MLHPQAQALLRLMAEKKIPPTHTLTPAQAREYYQVRRTVTQPEPPDVAEVRDLQATGPAGAIPLRLYRPAGSGDGEALPVLVYFHGGGWVIGDLETHDVLCRSLANGAGCAVVAVDYRLGPEHRFPAAVHDCVAATRWVRDNAAALQLDPARLAVGGDSAGGNLAAVVALDARDNAGPAIRYQLLIYPATDQRAGYASRTTNGKGYLLEQVTMDYFHDHYIGDRRHDADWRASPIAHTNLGGLPPALVLVAGYDPLRDEGIAYAQKLTEAGTPCSLISFEREIHGFITMGKVLDEANTAVRVCAAELRGGLGG
jgi:acetyl esterase